MDNIIIRAVAIISMVATLALVLYLPSAHPPSRFVEQIRREHATVVKVYGRVHATQIMARMLDMQSSQPQVSGPPAVTAAAPPSSGVNAAIASQVDGLGRRLFAHPYFRSIDALLALALYRVSVWCQSLPAGLVFALAALMDGLVVRVVRSKEFIQHNPEVYAACASAAIVTACACVVAFVLPMAVHPLWLAAAPAFMAACAGRALANYHRRS